MNIIHVPNICLGNFKLNYKREIKYFRLIFYRNLTWISHLIQLKDRNYRMSHYIKQMSRATSGLSPYVIKRYIISSRNMIIYDPIIWYKGTVKQKMKLIQMQRNALKNITKYYNTISSETSCVLAGCPLLDLKILEWN